MEILIHQTTCQKEITDFLEPSFEDEKEIIAIINEAMFFMEDEQKEKVQKLITYYEHLKYFSSLNSGLWIEFLKE